MPDIDSVMDYLLSYVVYHDDMAFIYDAENCEIKLGASGLGLIALVNYIEISGRQDLLDLCQKLADGIVYCLDDDWTFNHAYDSDLNLVDKTRTVYYDGEATYGLCRLYELTGDVRYLDVVENVIKNNFVTNVSSQVKRAKFRHKVYQFWGGVSPGSIPAEKVSL